MHEWKRNTDSMKPVGLHETTSANHNTVMIGGGTGNGDASSILSFTAPTGEFVMWISLGSASLHSAQFWKAFCKTLKRWSNVFAHHDQTEMPTDIKSLSKFAALINQAATNTGKAIVVVENYHLLPDGPVKTLIDNIKNSCAVRVSTVLISDQYVDISSTSSLTASRRTDQIIAFTRLEIQLYYTALNIVMDDRMLDELYAITGGWSKAVIRMGKYFPRGEPIHQEHVVQAINLLYQYFDEEYHASMKPELRQSLILLSLLDDFLLEMVFELTSVTAEDSKKLYLDHSFCFNDAVNRTCFHPLYHKYLVGIQNEVPKKTQFAFLRKVAVWYDHHNMVVEAVTCYVGCKEYDAIIPVLKKRNIPGLLPDEAAQIANCLESIPKQYMDKHPLHRLYLIFAKYFSGEEELALHMQKQLIAELTGKNRDATENGVLGELYVSKAYQAWIDMSIDYYQYMKSASELLPNGTAFLDVDEYYSPTGSVLHFHTLLPGQLLQAKEICIKTIPYLKKVTPNIGGSVCDLAVAEVHLYRCEYEEAIEYANFAVGEGVRTKSWGIVAESCYILQRIHMAIGELEDIQSYGRQVAEYSALTRHHALYSPERITQFHENVYFGLYHLLDSFADENPLVNQDMVNHINLGRELYVHAIYKVFKLREYYPALTFLDGASQVSHRTGMFFSRLKLLILKALVLAKMDQPTLAAKYLLDAYRMSYSNNILFSYIEFSEEMLFLLDAVAPHISKDELPQQWIANVTQLSEKYQQQRKYNTLEHLQKNPQIHPNKLSQLTRQEYIALKQVAMGRSTGEVSKIMDVSHAVIYRYLSRAYKKLGVEQRDQAIHIAIAEGILH